MYTVACNMYINQIFRWEAAALQLLGGVLCCTYGTKHVTSLDGVPLDLNPGPWAPFAFQRNFIRCQFST